MQILQNFRISHRKSSVVRKFSEIFHSLRKSLEILGDCRKWPKTPRYTKQNNIDVFVSFWYCYGEFFLLLMLKFLKFNCFMLESPPTLSV